MDLTPSQSRRIYPSESLPPVRPCYELCNPCYKQGAEPAPGTPLGQHHSFAPEIVTHQLCDRPEKRQEEWCRQRIPKNSRDPVTIRKRDHTTRHAGSRRRNTQQPNQHTGRHHGIREPTDIPAHVANECTRANDPRKSNSRFPTQRFSQSVQSIGLFGSDLQASTSQGIHARGKQARRRMINAIKPFWLSPRNISFPFAIGQKLRFSI